MYTRKSSFILTCVTVAMQTYITRQSAESLPLSENPDTHKRSFPQQSEDDVSLREGHNLRSFYSIMVLFKETRGVEVCSCVLHISCCCLKPNQELTKDSWSLLIPEPRVRDVDGWRVGGLVLPSSSLQHGNKKTTRTLPAHNTGVLKRRSSLQRPWPHDHIKSKSQLRNQKSANLILKVENVLFCSSRTGQRELFLSLRITRTQRKSLRKT